MHPVGPATTVFWPAALSTQRYWMAGPQPAQVRCPAAYGSSSGRSGRLCRFRPSSSNSGSIWRTTSCVTSIPLFLEADPVGGLLHPAALDGPAELAGHPVELGHRHGLAAQAGHE